MAVVESRLATVTEESKQAWSKLIELESTSSALKGEVRGLMVGSVCALRVLNQEISFATVGCGSSMITGL